MHRLIRRSPAVAVLALAGYPSVAAAQSSASDFTSATRYDAAGRVVGTIAPDPDGPPGPLRHAAVRNTYDAAGRLTSVENGELDAWQSEESVPANWPAFTVFDKVAIEYDGLDRKVKESVSGQKEGVWATQQVTQYSYDLAGRLECTAVRMDRALFGALSSSACKQSNVSNPIDRITKNIYDAAGQLVQVRNAVGTSLEQAYVTYGYWDAASSKIKPGYTPSGKQEYVVDANGNKARFTYDGFDRQDRWYLPSSTKPAAFNPKDQVTALETAGEVSTNDYESYEYDAAGNRTKLRKRDGREFVFTYDALNRMTAKIVPGACVLGYVCTEVAATATRDVYYSYDLRGMETVVSFDSPAGTDAVVNSYDSLGRLTSSKTSMGGLSRELAYVYDANGNRTRVAHPDNNIHFTYEYDGLDRPIRVRENGDSEVAVMTWDARGRGLSEQRGAVSTGYRYDEISRLSRIADDLAGTASDLTTSFERNPASQIVSRTLSSDAYRFTNHRNTNFGYAANGLNQYRSAGSDRFGYDANGNLITNDVVDANGQLKPELHFGYTYDAENRLVSTSAGTGLVYDPLGRIYEVSKPTIGTTRFLYDGDQLTLEYDASGNVLRRYVHGTGEDDPLLWYEGASLADRRSLQVNHQGSVVSIADTAGMAIEVNNYDAHGIPGASNIGRFQYTGQAWIPELGMYHYKARVYSPTLGRFLQTDAIGYDDNVNLYSYVANDPVNNVDPSGTECEAREGEGNPAPDCDSLAEIVVKGIRKKLVDLVGTADQPRPVRMTVNWITGGGRNYYFFPGNNKNTQEIANSAAFRRLWKKFQEKCGSKGFPDGCNYDNAGARFGLTGLLTTRTQAEQFIGSFNVKIIVSDGVANVTISNNSSFRSFLYGIGPAWERSSFRPMGNIRQDYAFQRRVR